MHRNRGHAPRKEATVGLRVVVVYKTQSSYYGSEAIGS
jgi:hypothetical protein